ncbi:MAG: hypothetical protein L0Z71_02305 [Anaerolineae bacterium]|nr:hypothetical protein [Anaerolineae bacterium]
MKTNQTTSIFGVLFHILAVVTGLFLTGISTWADMEAASYGFQRRASAPLRGLVCPILLTRNEIGTISLRVSNTTDKPLYPSVRTEISAAFDPELSLESLDLAPGKSKRLEWAVGPENIDLGNFIFANVQVYASYPIPNRERTCGIFIIDLPGSGSMIVTGLVAFSVIGLGWGLYSMSKSDFCQGKAGNVWNAIILLTVLIVSGLILSFMGSWIPSIGILVVSVLISILLLNSMIFRGG